MQWKGNVLHSKPLRLHSLTVDLSGCVEPPTKNGI
jgi:hypothetical protein